MVKLSTKTLNQSKNMNNTNLNLKRLTTLKFCDKNVSTDCASQELHKRSGKKHSGNGMMACFVAIC